MKRSPRIEVDGLLYDQKPEMRSGRAVFRGAGGTIGLATGEAGKARAMTDGRPKGSLLSTRIEYPTFRLLRQDAIGIHPGEPSRQPLPISPRRPDMVRYGWLPAGVGPNGCPNRPVGRPLVYTISDIRPAVRSRRSSKPSVSVPEARVDPGPDSCRSIGPFRPALSRSMLTANTSARRHARHRHRVGQRPPRRIERQLTMRRRRPSLAPLPSM